MKALRYGVLAVAILIGSEFWPILHAQTSPLFRMDITAAAAPNFGFSTVSSYLGVKFNVSFVASEGPGGRNLARVVLTPGGGNGCFQHHVWSGTPGVPYLPQGNKRYYRYYIRLSRIRGISQCNSPGDGVWGMKSVIEEANSGGQRAIEIWTPHQTTLQQFALSKNINGGTDETAPYIDALSGWMAVQGEIDSSTTPSTADGGYKLWRNNDRYAAPNARSAFRSTMDGTQGGFTFLFLDMIPTNETLTIDIAGFEVSDTFDPDWYANMGTNPPPPRRATKAQFCNTK